MVRLVDDVAQEPCKYQAIEGAASSALEKARKVVAESLAVKAEGAGTYAGGPGVRGACGVVHPKISHIPPALSTSLLIVVLVALDFIFDSRRKRIRK